MNLIPIIIMVIGLIILISIIVGARKYLQN